ncbi:hypothetical protein GCM10010174_78920 [Kutzneria viridogrisea]
MAGPGSPITAHPRVSTTPTAIILQPTILCPLDCTYCYLPQRDLSQRMVPATAETIAAAIPPRWSARAPVGIVWHGSESLAIGRSRLVELLAPFEPLRAQGRIQHVCRRARR